MATKTHMVAIGGHMYQPPPQLPFVRDQILMECYEPFIATLEKYSFVKISMNIAWSIGEHWPQEFLDRIKACYRSGQLELINTIAYHPLAPITPHDTLIRQIKMNEDFYRASFIDDDPLPGIFPPEMAFEDPLAVLFRKLGYKWCLGDDAVFVHSRGHLDQHLQAPSTWIPEARGVKVLLRSRQSSTDVAFKDSVYRGGDYARGLIQGMKEWLAYFPDHEKNYKYLYVDAETFNHHRKGLLEHFLVPFCEAIAESADAELTTLNSIADSFESKRAYIPPCTWSTDRYDRHPYHLWAHPDNEFHMLWNTFIKIAYAVLDPTTPEIEWLFDRSFYSCSPWQWAMGQKDIARWCLPGFQEITNLVPKTYGENWQMQRIINRLYDLTAA
jgi:alpha-amylase/alpha-mannosidase (GH57 family)